MGEWTVQFTLDVDPGEQVRVALQDRMDNEGLDVSVYALPGRRWAFSVGAQAADYVSATDAAGAVLAQYVDQPVVLALEALTLNEHQRRANAPTLPELLGAQEVAEMLHVSRQRVHQIAAANLRFPSPVVRVAMGPLWDARAVATFEREWDRKPGRPARAAS